MVLYVPTKIAIIVCPNKERHEAVPFVRYIIHKGRMIDEPSFGDTSDFIYNHCNTAEEYVIINKECSKCHATDEILKRLNIGVLVGI